MASRVTSKIVRWVDRDLANNTRPASLLPLFVFALLAILIHEWSNTAQILILAPLIAISILWLGFVSWRGWRVFRAASKRGDRHYDRTGKFALPPEYAETESATAARARRRRLGRKA